jgi:hypothetical protein
MRRKANTLQPIESQQLNGIKKLLKMEDVADISRVGRVKVYLLLRNSLPSIKIDGARCFQPGHPFRPGWSNITPEGTCVLHPGRPDC